MTTFRVAASRDDVFDAMLTPERGLEHADNVRSLRELSEPRADGTGGRWEVHLRAAMACSLVLVLETVAAQRPEWIQGRSSGDLEGVGRWEFTHRGGHTAATYHWDVVTTKPWMQVLERVARPLFVASHHRAMEHLVAALGRTLDAEVHDVRSRETSSDERGADAGRQ